MQSKALSIWLSNFYVLHKWQLGLSQKFPNFNQELAQQVVVPAQVIIERLSQDANPMATTKKFSKFRYYPTSFAEV